MDKNSLRNDFKLNRNNIDSETRKNKSLAINKRLEKLEIYRQAYVVMFYVSFGSEVDTHHLIDEALKDGKIIAVPLISKSTMLIKKIKSLNELKPKTMGILEPSVDATEISLKDINVVMVPGLAFTKKHYRLGYGGGYYDKLLSDPTHETFTAIGLAFSEQIVDYVPVEKHDQKVDFIVTDKKIV